MGDATLWNAIREVKGLLCLQCKIDPCDESDPRCLYSLAKSRTQYQRDYYQANRDKKLAATKARNAEKHDEYLAYQAAYREANPGRAT
jgi:hypothetical protein